MDWTKTGRTGKSVLLFMKKTELHKTSFWMIFIREHSMKKEVPKLHLENERMVYDWAVLKK